MAAGVPALLVAVALASLSPPARAERTLSLDDALQLARQNNRDLKVARARLVEASTGVAAAWAALLPTVNISGSYTRNYKNEVFADLFPVAAFAAILPPTLTGSFSSLGSIYVLKQDALAAGGTANLPILAPSAYFALTASKSTYRAAQANFDVSETSVLYSAATAFFAAAGADELLHARHDAVGVAQVTLSNAEARLAAGTVTRTEITRASLALLNAQQSEREATDTRDRTYRSLATILVLREPFRVSPPEQSAAPQEPPPVQVLAENAAHLRPEFAADEANRRAARDQAFASLMRWVPALSGFANANIYNYAGFTGDNFSWAFGLQLNWVLYDGGLRDAARRQYDAQALESELQLSELHDTVRDDITTAAEDLTTKRHALDTAQKSVALANETLSLLRAQYDAGTATQLDVLQAQDSLVSAQVQLAQARFDLAFADLTLRRNAGTFPDRERQ